MMQGRPVVLRGLRLARPVSRGRRAVTRSVTPGRRLHRQVALGRDDRPQPEVDQGVQVLEVAAAAASDGAAPRRGAAGRSTTCTDSTSNPPRSQQVGQRLAGVAADVVDRLVVRGPQPRVARARRRGTCRRAAAPGGPRPPRRRRRAGARARRTRRRGPARRRRRGSSVASARITASPRSAATSAPSAPYSSAAADQPRSRSTRVLPPPAAPTSSARPGVIAATARREQVPALAVPPVGVLERGELADLSAFHGRSSCQPRRPGTAPPCRCGPPDVVGPSARVGHSRIWPSPSTTHLVVVSSGSAIGPRACSFWVEMPISAPKPNSPPSVNAGATR